MTTRAELVAAARQNWNDNRGVDPDVLRDLGYDTPETLPSTIERVMGEEAVGHTTGLELVTEEHQPQPGARREASLRDRPPARTAKEKAARDQAQGLDYKTPPEWTPHLTSTDES